MIFIHMFISMQIKLTFLFHALAPEIALDHKEKVFSGIIAY